MRYLLDTHTCINLIKNPESVSQFIRHRPQDLAIGVISFYELKKNLETGSCSKRTRQALDQFLEAFNLVFLDGSAAGEAALIQSQLEAQNETIHPYDLMTAAIARSKNMVLVTDRIHQFKKIRGLDLETWTGQPDQAEHA